MRGTDLVWQARVDSGRLNKALDRMFKNFYHLLRPLKELRASPCPQDLLDEWRRAPKPTQGWRKGLFYDEALEVLAVSLKLPREETERLVWAYVSGSR